MKQGEAFGGMRTKMGDSDLVLAIAQVGFLTTAEKLLLLDLIDSEELFASLTLSDLQEIFRRRFRTTSFAPRTLLDHARADRNILTRKGIAYTFYLDSSYPPQLREIFDPPFLLFYRGVLPDYERPLAGVVGTRNPTGRAVKAAYRLGLELGAEGIGVVSGLARGIDGAAHEGNIAGEGKTVAVLGCGIDFIYPSVNRGLAVRILKGGGAIMSEYPPGTPAVRYHFPERNRILSGLARGVVVVEAPERSGALITADYALEQGRDLFVHAAGLDGTAGEGARRLAAEGAPTVSSGSDVLSEWGIEGRAPMSRVSRSESPLGMAELLAGELAGTLVRHRGEYFRRDQHG